jgi:hypothetical protein
VKPERAREKVRGRKRAGGKEKKEKKGEEEGAVSL